MTTTKRDAIEAAMSVANDVASGKLDPEHLEQQAVTELRDLVGTVVGEDDPLWPLQVQIANGVLAAGGVPTDELSEWLAVQRRRDGVETEPLSAPVPIDGTDTPPEVSSSASGTLSPENDAADDDDDFSDVPREVIKEAERAAWAIINEWRAQR
ncbi:flagellar hook-length control protein [Mycobacteroides abscessus]|nr:flagellar hook-length control protein [Mycobacteroides abscessus]MDM2099593.1 flagellar hook-length control protein [Mycobacteroides abscessus]MDM2115437.1 flagellar hook-length control protein [Mycobacteroides abscessus]MDM2147901.1 flagellar hook-length control protein [Mycobacteroides abscessus]MDM2166722.1 flagellar hook-length control protein [Mycobacteroides abscessus]MDM2189113.1 flagellar hook-length control protein [Mycobacteroides abscessus]